jgi:hypothetical protein
MPTLIEDHAQQGDLQTAATRPSRRSCTGSTARDGCRNRPLGWLAGYERSAPVRVGNRGRPVPARCVGRGSRRPAPDQVSRRGRRGRRLGRPTCFAGLPGRRVGPARQQPLGSTWTTAPVRTLHTMAWAGLDRTVHSMEHQGLTRPVDRWQPPGRSHPRRRLRQQLRRRAGNLHPVLRLRGLDAALPSLKEPLATHSRVGSTGRA